MLHVAIIGYGGIAGAHAPAWKLLEERGKAKLVAVCDIDPAKFTMKQETNISTGKELPPEVHTYTDYHDMLQNEKIDLVDICLPTPLHAPVATEVLRMGYHVQCEKPMARTYAQALAMLDAAKASGRTLMIGQGLRFALEYVFLKEKIESGEFGKPVSAVFRRLSGPPLWAWENWYMNHDMSGGCLWDMHIHDVDMIRFLFGEPKAVSCVTEDLYAGDDVVHSRFYYDNLAVTAIGDWSQEGVAFMSDYCIAFEKATVRCENGEITVYPRNGESTGEKWSPKLEGDNFFANELSFITDVVSQGTENNTNPPESAAATIRLCELLKQSADENGAVVSCE